MLIKKSYFLIVCLLIIGLILIYFAGQKEREREEQKTQQKIEEEKTEEYSFSVSAAKGIYPKFISGKFSKRPPEIQGGENLTASIKLEDPDGISSVKLTVIGQEESLKEEIQLELVEGDEFSGVWQGNLTIPVEITEIFWTNFYAKNKSDKTEDLSLKW